MKTIRFVMIGLAITLLIALGWRLIHRHAGATAEESADDAREEKKGVAHVEVAKVERKTIAETVTTYGSIIAQPGKIHSVSVAFETRVRHILVAPGQFVAEGDPLVESEPSPAALLQLQQARNAAEAARKDLKQT